MMGGYLGIDKWSLSVFFKQKRNCVLLFPFLVCHLPAL